MVTLIYFGQSGSCGRCLQGWAPLPAKVTMAFRLDADEWNGVRRVKFFVEAVQA